MKVLFTIKKLLKQCIIFSSLFESVVTVEVGMTFPGFIETPAIRLVARYKFWQNSRQNGQWKLHCGRGCELFISACFFVRQVKCAEEADPVVQRLTVMGEIVKNIHARNSLLTFLLKGEKLGGYKRIHGEKSFMRGSEKMLQEDELPKQGPRYKSSSNKIRRRITKQLPDDGPANAKQVLVTGRRSTD